MAGALARLQPLLRSSWLVYAPSSRLFSSDQSGAIRDAGGAFGKREKAQEDQYFRKLEQEQLSRMKKEAKKHHAEEIYHHEDEIKDLEEQIRRHKEKIARHKKKMEDNDD